MTEMNGPGVAFECLEQNGMHIWEDYYLVEIIDPETLQLSPRRWRIGGLVLTTLDRNVMPLIRYRTRTLRALFPVNVPADVRTDALIASKEEAMICLLSKGEYIPHANREDIGLVS